MNASEMTFGIEIETVAPDSAVREHGLRIGPYKHGIQVPYLPVGWTAEQDGSINVSGGGHKCEIVSPILQGTEGLAQVVEVVTALEAKGHRVNASCGVHYGETVVMWSRSHFTHESECAWRDQLYITFCLVGLQQSQPMGVIPVMRCLCSPTSRILIGFHVRCWKDCFAGCERERIGRLPSAA